MAENGGTQLTVTLAPPPLTDTLVKLAYDGTAARGTDFSAPASVVVAAGQASAVAVLSSLEDALPETTERLRAHIVPGSAFAVGTPSSVTVEINDDDGPLPVRRSPRARASSRTAAR